MGVPPSAQIHLAVREPYLVLLLTGMDEEDARFLGVTCREGDAAGTSLSPSLLTGDTQQRPGTACLSGSRAQFARLVEDVRADAARAELSRALGQALDVEVPLSPTILGGRTFVWGARTYLMGIVNVTPDSFSDGGAFSSADRAIEHGLALAEAGADVLDVGGESTRPGAENVSTEEELARVIPVVAGLRARTQVPLSVDTRKAGVARAALDAGASLVNDVSAFSSDADIAGVTARA